MQACLPKTRSISVNITVRSVWREQAVSSIYSECVFCSVSCLVFKRTVLHFFVSSVASLALSYFSTSSHKLFDFGGKKLLNLKRGFLLTLQLASKTFPILTTIQRDILRNVRRFLRKVPRILAMFKRKFNFFHRFSKNASS